MTKRVVVVDTETFSNATLFAGKVLETGEILSAWLHQPGAQEYIREVVLNPDYRFVTFNGNFFDMPIIAAMLKGCDSATIKEIANALIDGGMAPWDVERRYNLPRLTIDHIDLANVAPSFVGLKAYGARMHMPWLKEMPIDHTAELRPEDYEPIHQYCVNDLDTTEELYRQLKGPLELRTAMSRIYQVDMRSKSDTQMAEAAFIKRLNLRRGETRIPKLVEYTPPPFISFRDEEKRALTEQIAAHKFAVNPRSGHVVMPEFLHRKITTRTGTYQMGVGGLHSTHDKKVCWLAHDGWKITDIDAASFYPSIMVLGNMVPKNTGRRFIEEYTRIYRQRLDAKRNGDKTTAETLKISLNGTFGKTASRYSPLYSPDLMIAITLTGQLTLINLIEWLEEAEAEVLSANTDGIAIRYRENDEEKIRAAVSEYSEVSRFEFEYTPYRVLALKDVNNYLAVKLDRSIKAKGIYAPPDLRKNPTASICAKAVGQWLARGIPLEETIRQGVFKEYVSARNVTGGGVQGEEYLGKVVRWYLTTDSQFPPLTYRKNGNKVPKTDGARACMLMENPSGPPPDDLDYNAYLKEAIRIATDVGAGEYLTDEQRLLIQKPKPIRNSRKNKDS